MITKKAICHGYQRGNPPWRICYPGKSGQGRQFRWSWKDSDWFWTWRT